MKVFVDANLLIYLNVGSTEDILDFWITLLTRHDLYTDPLVLDEVIWVSKRKYNVSWRDTIDFIDEEILPYTTLLPIGEQEYREAANAIVAYNLKPSDAIHTATMKINDITVIVGEDRDYDKLPGIRRIWL